MSDFWKTNKKGERKLRPPLYHSWVAMRRYCGLVKGATPEQRKLYVGITVCPDWNSYSNFEAWGFTHGWQKGYHLTRRDKSKDFCPENCFWAPLEVANGYRSVVHRAKGIRLPPAQPLRQTFSPN